MGRDYAASLIIRIIDGIVCIDKDRYTGQTGEQVDITEEDFKMMLCILRKKDSKPYKEMFDKLKTVYAMTDWDNNA